MNIYLVERNDGVGYDQYDSAVVVAESPERAVELLKERHQSMAPWYPWGRWDVTVTEIDSSNEHIVLESFNAG
jgi:hypothetical protein